MYRCAVLQSQVDRLTCENTSTHRHSQAPDKPRRAPFATQSATHFDLALSNSTAIETSDSKSNPTEAYMSKPHTNRRSPGVPLQLVYVTASQALRPGDAGNPLTERLGGEALQGRGDYPQRSSADGFTDRSFLPIGMAIDLPFLHSSPRENRVLSAPCPFIPSRPGQGAGGVEYPSNRVQRSPVVSHRRISISRRAEPLTRSTRRRLQIEGASGCYASRRSFRNQRGAWSDMC